MSKIGTPRMITGATEATRFWRVYELFIDSAPSIRPTNMLPVSPM